MTPLSILTNLLQAIPSWLRQTLLILFALVVVAEQLARILEVDLAYDKVDQILVYVGGYLGVQSAANVNKPDVDEPDPQLELDYNQE